MLVSAVASVLDSSGDFCPGSHIGVDRQRINGTSFVFSTAVPVLLTVSDSEGITILQSTPLILSTLQENMRAILAVIDRVEAVMIPSRAASPIINIQLRSLMPSASQSVNPVTPLTPAPRDALPFDIPGEDRLLQDIVHKAQTQGM